MKLFKKSYDNKEVLATLIFLSLIGSLIVAIPVKWLLSEFQDIGVYFICVVITGLFLAYLFEKEKRERIEHQEMMHKTGRWVRSDDEDH